MNTRELARAWLFLIRTLGEEIILDSFDREQLRVVEVPDHAVMLEVLEQQGQPLRGVCADTKINDPIVNLGVDLNFISLRLVGDRLPRTSSAVLGHFVFCRPHINHLMRGSLPFGFFDSTIDLGRTSLSDNKVSIKLQVGEAFFV